ESQVLHCVVFRIVPFRSTALLPFLLPQAYSDRASDTRPSDVLLTKAYLQSWSLLLIEWAVSRLYRFGSPERMFPITRRLHVTWSISPLGGASRTKRGKISKCALGAGCGVQLWEQHEWPRNESSSQSSSRTLPARRRWANHSTQRMCGR